MKRTVEYATSLRAVDGFHVDSDGAVQDSDDQCCGTWIGERGKVREGRMGGDRGRRGREGWRREREGEGGKDGRR